MGKIHTPKYRIELTCINFVKNCKETHSYGFIGLKPTDQLAKKFRDEMNNSIRNGANTHLKTKQSEYSNAYIIEQKTGEIIAEYIAPMFEVI